MATKFYLEYGTSPAVTPAAWDSAWDYQNGTVNTYTATTTPGSTTLTEMIHTNNSVTSAQKGARVRFVSAALGAQTLSGTIKGQVQASETGAPNNATVAIAISVINSSGTIVGTLLAATASDLVNSRPNECVAGTLTNDKFADAAENNAISLSSYDCASGDRIVIELGFREVRGLSTESLQIGSNASSGDLPEDWTTEDLTYRPWVEFSNTISFGDTPSPINAILAGIATLAAAITAKGQLVAALAGIGDLQIVGGLKADINAVSAGVGALTATISSREDAGGGDFVHDTFTDTNGVHLQDHTGETGATWTLNENRWGDQVGEIYSNRLCQHIDPAGSHDYYASGTPSSADYDVTAVIYCVTIGAGYVLFFGRCSTSADTSYFVKVSTSLQQLYKVVGGTQAQLGDTNFSGLSAGQSYTFKLELRTDSQKVYLGANVIITGTDTAITDAGRVGVGVWSSSTSGVHLDEITGTNAGAEGGTDEINATMAGAGALSALISSRSCIDATLSGLGDLSVLATGRGELVGAAAGLGALSALLNGRAQLDALLAGVGALTATISSREGGGTDRINATMAGVGSLSAVLAGKIGITGASAGAGALSAALNGRGQATAIGAGLGALTALITGRGQLVGASAGVGSLSGLLGSKQEGAVYGTLAGVGSLSALANGRGQMVATCAGVGSLSGVLAGKRQIVAVIAATSSMSGLLAGRGSINATATGLGILLGVLSSRIDRVQLSAVLSGFGGLSALMQGRAQLVALCVGTGRLTAILRTPVTEEEWYDTDLDLFFDEVFAIDATVNGQELKGIYQDPHMKDLGIEGMTPSLICQTREVPVNTGIGDAVSVGGATFHIAQMQNDQTGLTLIRMEWQSGSAPTTAEDLDPFFADFGSSARIGLSTMDAISDRATQEDLAIMGYSLQLIVRTEDIPQAARIGSAITHEGTQYTIKGMERDGSGMTLLQLRERD